MRHYKFRLDIIPPTTTAQQKAIIPYIKKDGNLGRIPFKPTKVKKMESLYKSALEPYVPAKMFEGAIVLKIGFFFPYNKTEKKKIRTLGIPYPKLTIPDADNMSKSFIDQMSDLKFWNNDSQIFPFSSKWFWEKPGIEVEIWAIEELSMAWNAIYALDQQQSLIQPEFSFIQ